MSNLSNLITMVGIVKRYNLTDSQSITAYKILCSIYQIEEGK